MARADVRDILGNEYDWLACDRTGFVAVFCTAGGGLVASSVLDDLEAQDEAIAAIHALPCVLAVSDEFAALAARGVFVFDADYMGGPYKAVATPQRPRRLDELPESVAAVACRVRFTELTFLELAQFPEEILERYLAPRPA